MLVSEKGNFLFIHIQKTGGTSLSSLLKQHLPDVQEIKPVHGHALWVNHKLTENWSSLYKFAFVRNPWDRLVSWYSMIDEGIKRYGKNIANKRWLYVANCSSTFEEFVLNCTGVFIDEGYPKGFFFNQLDYITDSHQNLLVDFIGKFENFEQDAHKALSRLGIKNVQLPHYYKTGHLHYSHYYSDTTQKIVGERFARDIDYWSYRFERK